MQATIGNPPIHTAEQFHAQIAEAMFFPHYYGKNLDALWDVLRIDIERPVELVWLNSNLSSEVMPDEFAEIVALCREVTAEDVKYGVAAPFELVLK